MPSWVSEANWPESWSDICFSPIVRSRGEYVVYVGGGGVTKFYKYNITTDAWTELAVPPSYLKVVLAMSPNGTKLVGFRKTVRTLYLYDIAGNSWTSSTVAPWVTGSVQTDYMESIVWADNDTIWCHMSGNVGGVWRIKFFKYVISTDTWTQYANYLEPSNIVARCVGISPDGASLYAGGVGSNQHEVAKYVIATDTYTGNAIDIGSDNNFIEAADANRLWYGLRPGNPYTEISSYVDLSNESLVTGLFPSNPKRTKVYWLNAGLYGTTGVITDYGEEEPKNWSFTPDPSYWYRLNVRGINLPYEDLDKTKELHVILKNLSPTAKKAGADGELVIEVSYEPAA